MKRICLILALLLIFMVTAVAADEFTVEKVADETGRDITVISDEDGSVFTIEEVKDEVGAFEDEVDLTEETDEIDATASVGNVGSSVDQIEPTLDEDNNNSTLPDPEIPIGKDNHIQTEDTQVERSEYGDSQILVSEQSKDSASRFDDMSIVGVVCLFAGLIAIIVMFVYAFTHRKK